MVKYWRNILDSVTKENIEKHNLNQPNISNYRYGIFITAGSERKKNNIDPIMINKSMDKKFL